MLEQGTTGLRVAGSGSPVMPTDRWHLGSLTKAMTSTVAAVLVERGVVAWNTTVGDVFPDLAPASARSTSQRASTRCSLTSPAFPTTTRVPYWATLAAGSDPSPLPEQRRRWAAELLALPPEVPPGSYSYTNAGYIVAGAMLEELTGEPWETLMIRELFEPLGATEAGFGPPGRGVEQEQPWGHFEELDGWRPLPPESAEADNPAAIGPAGTVHMNLPSMALYMMEHLRGARGVAGLVSTETFRKLHTPPPGSSYALGWGEQETPFGVVLNHKGSNVRWFATLGLLAEQNVAVIAVTNAGGTRAESAVDDAGNLAFARFQAWVTQQ